MSRNAILQVVILILWLLYNDPQIMWGQCVIKKMSYFCWAIHLFSASCPFLDQLLERHREVLVSMEKTCFHLANINSVHFACIEHLKAVASSLPNQFVSSSLSQLFIRLFNVDTVYSWGFSFHCWITILGG